MAHRAQQKFCERVKSLFPEKFRNSRVLEVGSRNVNGSIRRLFSGCKYVGLDAVKGVDVDVVCLGHEYNEADSSFDVVCSVECFEHDPYAKETIHNMLRILKPGGLFFMSCAGVGRPEHGTEKTGESYGPHSSFYRNVSLNEMVSWMTSSSSDLSVLHVERSSAPEDLYCFGIKNESK